MGITCSLAEASVETFEGWKENSEKAPDTTKRRISIDRAWLEFHDIFSKKEEPLCYLIQGDFPAGYGSEPLDLHSSIDVHCVYQAFISPEKVVEMVSCLDSISPLDIKAEFEKAGLDFYDDYDGRHFRSLCDFYRGCAEKGYAVLITIC